MITDQQIMGALLGVALFVAFSALYCVVLVRKHLDKVDEMLVKHVQIIHHNFKVLASGKGTMILVSFPKESMPEEFILIDGSVYKAEGGSGTFRVNTKDVGLRGPRLGEKPN